MKEQPVPAEYEDKVAELKEMIVESVAQTDEVLLDKFINGEELTKEEIYNALINGCVSGDIAPVMCGSATKVIGMTTLLEDILECFPTPEYAIPQKAVDLTSNEEVFIGLTEDKPFSALVFKTIADPFVGKISLFRVITGNVKPDQVVVNTNNDKQEKLSNLFFLRGKQQFQTTKVIAGDIGAVSKLQFTKTGDSLCDPKFKVIYDKFNFPEPVMTMSVIPKSKGDEEKISSGLSRLLDEDPTFTVKRDTENAETLISGLGETHIEILASKLKNKFGADVRLELPKGSIQGDYKEDLGCPG